MGQKSNPKSRKAIRIVVGIEEMGSDQVTELSMSWAT